MSSSSDTRIGQDCAHFDACFVTRMKREAEAARIVVVNHHLFFADPRAARPPRRRAAIPDYDAVIFDEAHQLEDIATDFFGVRVSSARVQSMLRDAERAFVAAGTLRQALAQGRRRRHRRDCARRSGPLLHRDCRAARGASAFGARAGDAPEGKATVDRDFWSGDVLASYHKLDAALEALAGYAEAAPNIRSRRSGGAPREAASPRSRRASSTAPRTT